MGDMPARGAAPLRRPVPPARSPQNPRRRSVNGTLQPEPSRGMGFASTREEISFEDEEEEDIKNVQIGMSVVNEEVDYYALLGVPRDATSHQIRSAYLRLSLSLHPDKQPPELKEVAEAHFGKIVRAYEVLQDERRRHVYDTMGESGLQGNWALGPKGMSQEQFKTWLDEQVRRGKMDLVERLIQSHGEIIVSTIVPSQLYDQVEYARKGVVLPSTPEVQKVSVKHGFRVGLTPLQALFDAPLKFWRKEELEEVEEEKSMLTSDYEAPSLHIKTGVTMDVHGQMMPSYNVGYDIEHSFPHLQQQPKYLSLSSLLQNSTLRLFGGVLPRQHWGLQLSKPFDNTHASLQASVGGSLKRTPPALNLNITRPITQRTSLILSGNLSAFYPEFMRPYGFGLPDTGRKYRAGTAFAIGLNIQPKLVYSASQSRRAGKAILKPERSGQKINVILQSSPNEITTVRVDYSRAFFPFGISRDEIPASPDGPKPTTRGIEMNANLTLSPIATPDGNITIFPMFGMAITHRITKFTRMGVGYQFNQQTGVILTLNWSRLGQSIVIPTTIGLNPTLSNATLSFAVPLTAYAAVELLYLRPKARREQKRILRSHLQAIKTYLEQAKQRTGEEVALMQDQVMIRQDRERSSGGLVIQYAEYGASNLKGEVARLLAKVDESVSERIVGSGGARVMIDVTLAVANLVQNGQVIVSKKTKKPSIVGFYDPVPFERKKVLKVRYIFNQVEHEALFREDEAIVMPLREHALEGTTPVRK